MSQAATRPTPPANAAPWTRAITGLGHSWIVRSIVASFIASARFSSCEYCDMRRIQFEVGARAERRALGGQHDGAHSRGRRRASRNASVSSAIVVSLKALRTSARVIQTRRDAVGILSSWMVV